MQTKFSPKNSWGALGDYIPGYKPQNPQKTQNCQQPQPVVLKYRWDEKKYDDLKVQYSKPFIEAPEKAKLFMDFFNEIPDCGKKWYVANAPVFGHSNQEKPLWIVTEAGDVNGLKALEPYIMESEYELTIWNQNLIHWLVHKVDCSKISAYQAINCMKIILSKVPDLMLRSYSEHGMTPYDKVQQFASLMPDFKKILLYFQTIKIDVVRKEKLVF
jgi:hypothetical protein